jgi:hypothetical protein
MIQNQSLARKSMRIEKISGLRKIHSLFHDNIPFKPQDNSVFIGKNSQIKPRKNEQGK